MVIAIDGPAASGKSSVARRLARKIGFDYVNSGAIYRAVTWELLREGIDPARLDSVDAALARMSLDCGFSSDGEFFIRVNSELPEVELRESSVNSHVSEVSTIPAVRRLVGSRLHAIAAGRRVVMEGRDIGTAVFPETPHKFYLDAAPEVRRRRRDAEGHTDSIEKRDRIDSTRRHAPLSVAPDANVIDTSHLSLEGVVSAITAILARRGIGPA